MAGIGTVAGSVGGLLALFVAGLPIFVAFILCNLIAVWWLLGVPGFGMFANSLLETATTGTLVTIPLFILMGEVLFRAKAADVLFESVDQLIGRVPGRQFVLSIVVAAIFSALSGAAMGVAAMLGRALLPGMRERGYDVKLSAGTILAGASLAPIVPPSILVIVIGTLANVSIAQLLIAGILPGMLLAALFLGYCVIKVGLNPALAPDRTDRAMAPADARTRIVALLRVAPFSLVIITVMGFIMLGIATPSEAAATGVFGALGVAAFYRSLSWRMIGESLAAAASIATVILVIMASSKLFSQLLAFTGGTTALTKAVVGLGLPSWGMLIALMAFPFVLCMFIDQIALMLVVIPIYQPLVASIGFDPIWFWLLFLINITVGGMTPPFGYTLFALKGASDIPITQLYAAAWPFVGLCVLGMVILAVAPGIVTFLPSLF